MSGGLYWFKPPRPSARDLQEYLDHLHPLGVRWCDSPNAPEILYRLENCQLIASIGAITVGNTSGLIRIHPCRGVGRIEGLTLAAIAQQAFERKPTRAAAWHSRPATKHHEAGWIGWICIAVEEGGHIGTLVARHQESMSNENSLQLRTMIRDASDMSL